MQTPDYPDNSFWNRAAAPLPNPGEGGPVFTPSGSTPGSLLPNLGEGGPVFNPPGSNPGSLLPNLGEGGPVFNPPGSNPGSLLPNLGEGGPVRPIGPSIPVIPLPNPGEGGPVAPGRPQPNLPCYYCNNNRSARVRFLNAAYGYPSFRIYINNFYVANGLGFAALTPYGQVANGFQTITVTGSDGYVYLQKSMPFRGDSTVTIAVVNASTGLDLLEISDTSCQRPPNFACFRVCNLAYYGSAYDVFLSDGRMVYSDVRFKETTSFKRVVPGEYSLYLTETSPRPQPRYADIETLGSEPIAFSSSQPLVSFYVRIRSNAIYTAFLLSRGTTPDALQVLIVEDR